MTDTACLHTLDALDVTSKYILSATVQYKILHQAISISDLPSAQKKSPFL